MDSHGAGPNFACSADKVTDVALDVKKKFQFEIFHGRAIVLRLAKSFRSIDENSNSYAAGILVLKTGMSRNRRKRGQRRFRSFPSATGRLTCSTTVPEWSATGLKCSATGLTGSTTGLTGSTTRLTGSTTAIFHAANRAIRLSLAMSLCSGKLDASGWRLSFALISHLRFPIFRAQWLGR